MDGHQVANSAAHAGTSEGQQLEQLSIDLVPPSAVVLVLCMKECVCQWQLCCTNVGGDLQHT